MALSLSYEDTLNEAATERRAHIRISACLQWARTSLPGWLLAEFEIARVTPSEARPHGLDYSFTLHGPDNRRLIGFDNAHAVPAKGSRFKKRSKTMDHWHRTESDAGRPYVFVNAEQLIDDFFDEVERVLSERGVPLDSVEVIEGDRP
jgi:Family of unknown function (DUF6516)